MMSFIDIELKEPIDIDLLKDAINNGDTVYLKTKDNTSIFLNNINVLAIEILNTPPIPEKNTP